MIKRSSVLIKLYHSDASKYTTSRTKSRQWTGVKQIIHKWPPEYKLLSLTNKVLTTTQPSYLHNFITVQPHSLVHLHYLLSEQQIVPSSMLPLVSGINSRLLSVNHALTSPILTHPVLRVALPPSTRHSHHPSPLHSFIPDLKPSFSANLSLRSLPFLLPDGLHRFPRLFTNTSEHSHFFVLFLFSTF